MLLYICPGKASAQAKQYFFSHYNATSGLLSNRVQCLTQDDKGFLWIGTVNGLQRFDGHWFVNFRHNPQDVHSIPFNDVWYVHIDKKKRLWVLFTNGQAGIFDMTTFRFKEIRLKLEDERIRMAHKTIMEDSRGNIMLMIPNITMLTFNEAAGIFSSEYNVVSFPPNWRPWSVREEPGSGKYWIASDAGLAVYNSASRQLSYPGHNTGNEPAVDRYSALRHVGVLHIDQRKRMWFQSWDKGSSHFFCYDLQAQEPILTEQPMGEVIGRYCEPKQIIEQNDGRIIVTGTPILAEFSEEQKKFIAIQSSLAADLSTEFNHVLHSYMDREQNVWLCTRNEGMYKFNPVTQSFSSIRHINPRTRQAVQNGLLSFMQLRDGSFLAAAWGEGIIRYDSNLNIIPLDIRGIAEDNNINVWSMTRRKDGIIWMGLQDDGGNIMVYDEQSGIAKQYRSFHRVTVRQLVEDAEGNMWIGTQSKGLFKWTAGKALKDFNAGFERFEQVPATQVNKLSIDPNGFLWVSTIAEGAYKIDTKNGTVLEHLTDKSKPALPGRGTTSLMPYNDSLVLIANGGLVIYNTKRKTISTILASDGLPSGYIESIQKDEAGLVWLGLLNGLCRLNIFKKTINYYDREDGMVNDNFIRDATCRLRDGRLLFGTNRDLLVFNPKHIISNETPPDVRITEFRLRNKPLAIDSLQQAGMVRLDHDNNSFSIDFSSLTYLQKNKLTYYYMLEGLDKDWTRADHITRANYPYLAPGEYIFKVKAENSDGLSSTNTTALKIAVSPPFWQTWWFYSLLALVTAMMLYLLDRERMKRKEALHKIRSEIAGNLHGEINTALNNINILSEMARLKADKEPQKSKEFIEQIHSRSHNMIIAMDDMLWCIDPQNDSMAKTVLRLREYIDGLNSQYGANIEMLVDEKVNDLKLGMQFRHEAFILFRESIEGLLKVRACDCKIYMGVERSGLVYTIEFRNHLCDMQQLRQLIERQDIKKRLLFLKASSNVQVHKEHTVFELVLPIYPSTS
jgi:ligand-binding sensor domain-containing protein